MKKKYSSATNLVFIPMYRLNKNKNVPKERNVVLLLYGNQYSQIKKIYTFIGAKDGRNLFKNRLTTFSTDDVLKYTNKNA